MTQNAITHTFCSHTLTSLQCNWMLLVVWYWTESTRVKNSPYRIATPVSSFNVLAILIHHLVLWYIQFIYIHYIDIDIKVTMFSVVSCSPSLRMPLLPLVDPLCSSFISYSGPSFMWSLCGYLGTVDWSFTFIYQLFYVDMYASGAQVYICVFQPGIIESLLLATVKRPWLWGVYVFAVGLPAILFISFMWPDKVKYEWLCEYGFVCFGLARQIVKLQKKKTVCVCVCVACRGLDPLIKSITIRSLMRINQTIWSSHRAQNQLISKVMFYVLDNQVSSGCRNRVAAVTLLFSCLLFSSSCFLYVQERLTKL